MVRVGPNPSDWEPHDLSSFPPDKRRTVAYLDTFEEARCGGGIPTQCFQSLSPDYEAEQAVITIYPDSPDFRSAVEGAMPEGSYRIVVENIRHVAGTA